MQGADGNWRYAAGTASDPCACSRVWTKCSDSSQVLVPIDWQSSGVYRVGTICYTATTTTVDGCPVLKTGTRTSLAGCYSCGYVYEKCTDASVTINVPDGHAAYVKYGDDCYHKTSTRVYDADNLAVTDVWSCLDVRCPPLPAPCEQFSGIDFELYNLDICDGCISKSPVSAGSFRMNGGDGGSIASYSWAYDFGDPTTIAGPSVTVEQWLTSPNCTGAPNSSTSTTNLVFSVDCTSSGYIIAGRQVTIGAGSMNLFVGHWAQTGEFAYRADQEASGCTSDCDVAIMCAGYNGYILATLRPA